MKKKVLASLLCASMVATMFAGCGSGNGGNGTEKADKKDGGKETILLAKMSRIYLIKTYIRHLCFSHLWEYLFLPFYHCCS